jgi:hypothetical protein
MTDCLVSSLVSSFNRRFNHWSIKLPSQDGRVPERGEIMEAGWVIWFLFGDLDGEIYLDYYACHRMTNDRHVRLYADGRTENLPVLTTIRQASDDPLEDKRFAEEYAARNSEVAILLDQKGFAMEGNEPGLMQVNRWLSFNSIEDEG